MENKKYAIVTGASRGLGAACARELAREGFDLIITYNGQAAKAAEVKESLEKEFGVRVEACQHSIQDLESYPAFKAWVLENFGTNLQVLVNNAGIYVSMPGVQLPPEKFAEVQDVNIKGTYYMCYYFVPLMIDNHFGKVINLCSAVGLRAASGSEAYSASKFAVRGLTQALAIDLGQYNIQVNAIAPGSHKTDMYWSAYKQNPALMDTRTKQCPLQRAGEVEEMEFVVRYFMSSNFITGQVVSPNGGTTMV